ncbi:MAG: hypothetical protein HY813_00715 [Candidatus Portnoybacteria bacterium]|nr:hypothetical protein [Candidatus Portnoybacteria bacterium]
MENMLSRSTLQKNRRLLNEVEERLIGPDREFWESSLERFLRKEEPVFLAADALDSFRKEKRSWQKFYKKIFGQNFDFSTVCIPERPGSTKDWCLIILAEGMTPQRLFDKCREQFGVWKWTDDNFDKIVHSDRTAKGGHYAVWVRSRVEADEEFKNLSANDLKARNHQGVTLEERLVLELYYFWKTKKHLDFQNITLCTGSRYSDGSVPRVHWRDAELRVYWCPSGRAHAPLRSREAVS